MLRPFTLLVCTLALTAGCSRAPQVQTIEGFAQGTSYHISWWLEPDQDSPKLADHIRIESARELARLDALISNYREDSVIQRFNAQTSTEPQEVGSEIVALVKTAQVISRASQGCYDLTISPLFELWGFKADAFANPESSAVEATRTRIGMDKLEVVDASHLRKRQPELQVDLSSIGQGYSVGQVAKTLEALGVQNYLVEIGGELQTQGMKPGQKPWRVAVEKPLPGERSLQKILTINRATPTAVMTSGTYRHFFEKDGKRYSHILDARSGYPVSHNTVSVTVLHADPAIADAWGTALLCLGYEASQSIADREGIAAFFITQDGDTLQNYDSAALKAQTAILIE